METELDRVLASEEGRQAYCQEHAIMGVTEHICKLMNDEQLSQATLADRMGLTAGRISQMLDGEANLTLATVARVLAAFDRVLKVDSEPLRPALAAGAPPLSFSDHGDWAEVEPPNSRRLSPPAMQPASLKRASNDAFSDWSTASRTSASPPLAA